MEYFNVFKGYCNKISTPLIIDRNKDVVAHYLINHRKLDPKECMIEGDTVTDNELYLHYEDQCTTQYRNYVIPNIDAQIIEYHKSFMDSEIYDIIQRTKRITLLAQDIKGVSENEIETLIKAMKVLSKFATKPKILRQLADEEVVTDSILYCGIDDYLIALRQFKDHREMKNRWEYLCSDETE